MSPRSCDKNLYLNIPQNHATIPVTLLYCKRVGWVNVANTGGALESLHINQKISIVHVIVIFVYETGRMIFLVSVTAVG